MWLNILRNSVFFLICLFLVENAAAQTQPQQDCFNAISVCQAVYNQANSYTGIGNLDEIFVSNCLATGENNSVWYIFTVSAPGNLGFNITPNNALDDYDWAVYNLTNASCSDIATDPTLEVSCNYSGTPGATGANGTSGFNTQGAAGTPGNAFIPVVAGQTFVLVVDNFSASQFGYQLDFSSSTATIFDNVPPAMTAVNAPGCGSDTVNITFSENILCSSIQASDFAIIGPPGTGPFTVTSVSGFNCLNGGTFENNFTITVSPSLVNIAGAYNIQLVGPVQDNCGNVSINTAIPLLISPINMTASANPNPICFGQNTTLTTTLSGQAGVSFSWSPGNLSGPSPVVSPPTTTTYNVTATNAGGCQASASVTVQVSPPINVVAYAAPQTICAGNCATLSTNFSTLPGYNTQWLPGGFGGPTLNVCPQNTITYTALLSDANGCTGQANVTVNVNPVPTADFTVSAQSVCVNTPLTVNFTGVAAQNAGYVWDFDGGVVVPANPIGQGPYQVYWTIPGVKNITLQINQNGCLSSVFTQQVTVNQNPTATFAFPTNICSGVCNQIVYTGNASANANYNWDFGGGVTCSPAPGAQGPYQVQWTPAGTYIVCLSVTENGCSSPVNCQTLTVKPSPTACIVPVGDSCQSTSCYNFSYCGTPNVDAYFWSIPGGIPSSATNPNPSCVHYNNAGPQTVWMYSMDDGCLSDTAFINFNVLPDPVANFSYSTGNACLGSCVTFTYNGPSVSNLQYFNWDFGVNASPQFSTNDTVSCVTFNSPGFQTVRLIVCNQQCCDTSYQTIFVNPQPVVSAGPDKSFCQGDGPVQLDGYVIPGTGVAPYTYNWTCNAPANACGINMVGTTTPMVNPLNTPTQYYFQATDANGCKSNIDSAIVTIKEKPKVYVGPDQSRCGAPNAPGVYLTGIVVNGGTVPGPYTYSWFCNDPNGNCGGVLGWDSLQQTVYVSPQQTTIYTLVVTAANGCSSDVNTLDTMSTVTVNVSPIPIVDAGPDRDICKGQTIQMLGNATGAGPIYTFSWTPSDAQAGLANPNSPTTNATPQFTQLYTLSATSNGCTGTDTMRIRVHTLPSAAIHPPVGDICQGDSLLIQGIAFGDPNATLYNYSWTVQPGGGTQGISNPTDAFTWVKPLTNTSYVLYISTGFCEGYVDTINVTVRSTPIAIVHTQDTIVCRGTVFDFDADYQFVGTAPATPVIFKWTPNTGLSADNVLEPTLTATQTTIYTLTTSIAGQCPTTDEVYVQVIPFEPVTIKADTAAICKNTTATLTAEGGINTPTYTWSPDVNISALNTQTVIVSPQDTFTYYVTMNEGGCSGIDSIEIIVLPTPVADYVATHTQGCGEVEVKFYETGTDALSYIWNFGDESSVSNQQHPTHLYTQPGTYPVTLTVIGTGGCRDSVTLQTITVNSDAFATFTSDPAPGDSLFLPGKANVNFTDASLAAVSWLWDFGDGSISTDMSPSHNYTLPGTYTVTLTVTNIDGCSSTYSQFPYIVVNPDFFAPNTFTPNGDGAHDTWIISYYGTETIQVGIFDRWGHKVFESNSSDQVWDGNDLKGKQCADGVYFYTVKIGEKVINGNVLIVR